MRLPALLLLLALALLASLAASFALGEPPGGHGVAHANLPAIDQGGPGAARHARVWPLAWALGSLEIAFFVACLALGARRRGRVGAIGRPLLLFGLLYEGVWSALVLAYRSWAADPGNALLLSFPAPTAVMLFALWPVPLLFLGLYVWGFERYVLDADDLERFRTLLAERRRQREGGG